MSNTPNTTEEAAEKRIATMSPEKIREVSAKGGRVKSIYESMDDLLNETLIDQMYHEWTRYQSVTFHVNKQALWERWIRV